MSFSRLQTEHLRLTILALLKEIPGYELNEKVLGWGTHEQGYPASQDALRVQFHWLSEQGLVTITHVAGILQVVKLTRRGLDVASGLALVPGVARPEPEDA